MKRLKQFLAKSDAGNHREPRPYSGPTLVELGSIVALTLGDGTSDVWDMGAGFKKAE